MATDVQIRLAERLLPLGGGPGVPPSRRRSSERPDGSVGRSPAQYDRRRRENTTVHMNSPFPEIATCRAADPA